MKKKKGDKIMTKRFGFTLAEVLITLGIIGVVAAMTIPTLIANTNSAKFRSQYKKTVSTLNQAGLMATAQYDVDYSNAEGSTAASALSVAEDVSNASLASIFKATLTVSDMEDVAASATGAYTLGGETYQTKNAENNNGLITGIEGTDALVFLRMADGSMLAFSPLSNQCDKDVAQTITQYASGTGAGAANHCLGFIDVNGPSLPNREVNCNGSAAAIADGTCEVAKKATEMTDIYPVAFHNATVEPITPAARYVLTTSK